MTGSWRWWSARPPAGSTPCSAPTAPTRCSPAFCCYPAFSCRIAVHKGAPAARATCVSRRTNLRHAELSHDAKPATRRLDAGSGCSGECLAAQANFPFQTRGRIMAPVLLTQLAAPSEPTALHAVVMSFDGYLYMIDGASGAMRHLSTFSYAAVPKLRAVMHCGVGRMRCTHLMLEPQSDGIHACT